MNYRWPVVSTQNPPRKIIGVTPSVCLLLAIASNSNLTYEEIRMAKSSNSIIKRSPQRLRLKIATVLRNAPGLARASTCRHLSTGIIVREPVDLNGCALDGERERVCLDCKAFLEVV